MKLLIAYDESPYSDAALKDLARAGLASDTEAIVVSVVERRLVSNPPSLLGVSAAYAPAMLPDYERQVVESASEQLLAVTNLVQARFPEWKLSAEICLGSPVTQILAGAEEWKPDLIIVGSHNRSALGRLFLGSVSQDIVRQAHCSVRIGRESDVESDAPVRFVVGVDGSPGSVAALRSITKRRWPSRSQARVVASLDLVTKATPHGYLAQMAKGAEVLLQASGLECSSAVRVGEASQVLTNEAKEWGADCIFVGATGLTSAERVVLGNTSADVAANAGCSVEVVRPANNCEIDSVVYQFSSVTIPDI